MTITEPAAEAEPRNRPQATIEELVARMTDLHGDEWQVRISGNGQVVVEWAWEDAGDPDGDDPTFEASCRYVQCDDLRRALEIATRAWQAIETYGWGVTWGWCCRLCGEEAKATPAGELWASLRGAHHLQTRCKGRP